MSTNLGLIHFSHACPIVSSKRSGSSGEAAIVHTFIRYTAFNRCWTQQPIALKLFEKIPHAEKGDRKKRPLKTQGFLHFYVVKTHHDYTAKTSCGDR